MFVTFSRNHETNSNGTEPTRKLFCLKQIDDIFNPVGISSSVTHIVALAYMYSSVVSRFILCDREELYESIDSYNPEESMMRAEEAARTSREELLAQVDFDK